MSEKFNKPEILQNNSGPLSFTGPLLLIILDGYALNPDNRGNAVSLAQTPCLDKLFVTHPHTTLCSFGERVGLPNMQMGNSEVGHLNIGGGRIVKQELTRINEAIALQSLSKISELKNLCNSLVQNDNAALHLIGLISQGGVHSQYAHFSALLEEVLRQGARKVVIHAIADGRDRPPKAAAEEIVEAETFVRKCREDYPEAQIEIATLIGRFYAMDRDTRWERTQKAYNLFTKGEGEVYPDISTALDASYKKDISDEFLKPMVIGDAQIEGSPLISDGDSVLFFNFRADRMRQIVTAFFEKEQFTGFNRDYVPKLSSIVSLTSYDENFPLSVLFSPTVVKRHLGEILSESGLRQLRIAETEKYPHVTYFFNGGDETPSEGENRILIPSKRNVPTYDLVPEMSAPELTENLIEQLRSKSFDVAIVNYANCDMVGHSGNLEATVKAVEAVDHCLSSVLDVVEELNGVSIVTADHGNADQMVDYQTGEPHTFHTTHPVPLILVGRNSKECTLRGGGSLCDIAPSILHLLNINKPKEMTGESLVLDNN